MNVSGVTEATISSLIPSTTYSIQVAAENSAGIGVYSAPEDAETDGTRSYKTMSSYTTYMYIIPFVQACLCLAQYFSCNGYIHVRCILVIMHGP